MIRNDPATHLCDDHVLFKRGKANDVLKQRRLGPVKVFAGNQSQRIVVGHDGALRSLLVPVRFAKDDLLIDAQLLVSTPSTDPHVIVEAVPVSTVVLGVVRNRLACIGIELGTVLATSPNQPIAM